jgi:hypothetical protein
MINCKLTSNKLPRLPAAHRRMLDQRDADRIEAAVSSSPINKVAWRSSSRSKYRGRDAQLSDTQPDRLHLHIQEHPNLPGEGSVAWVEAQLKVIHTPPR